MDQKLNVKDKNAILEWTRELEPSSGRVFFLSTQGDQIGRIFAQWVDIFFGLFLKI
jgi:hypothetical protein